jgi:poly(3-hydroxybutyrate) depolymerase
MSAGNVMTYSPFWSPPRGHVLLRALRSDPTQEYLAYVPHSAGRHAPVLVSVHGVSRNAHEQAAVFSELCDAHGAVLVAPIFNVDQHKDYQRLGRKGRGARVDHLLHRHLAEMVSLSGADATQVYLFGFSAGAQFAHRYLLAHPHRVARAVVVAAGWYTFPDATQRFPYGIRSNGSLEGVVFNPERFLRVPVEVVVGGRDVGSTNLKRGERVDAQQGTNRLERARRWVGAMRAAAEAHGLEPTVTLTEVPNIDHSFREFCARGALVERVGRFLFRGSSALGAASTRPAEECVRIDALQGTSVPGT